MEADGVVLFDGVCNFCNKTVQFLLKRDRADKLRFASLQSDTGKSLLTQAHYDQDYKASILFFSEGKVYQKSDAFCQIMRRLRGGWRLFYWIKLIPRAVRDRVYDFISSHRYQWFGRQDHCMIPPPEWKKKFLS